MLAAGGMDAAPLHVFQRGRRTRAPCVDFVVFQLREVEPARCRRHDERAHFGGVAQRVLEAGPSAHRLRDERDVVELQLADECREIVGVGIRCLCSGNGG